MANLHVLSKKNYNSLFTQKKIDLTFPKWLSPLNQPSVAAHSTS